MDGSVASGEVPYLTHKGHECSYPGCSCHIFRVDEDAWSFKDHWKGGKVTSYSAACVCGHAHLWHARMQLAKNGTAKDRGPGAQHDLLKRKDKVQCFTLGKLLAVVDMQGVRDSSMHASKLSQKQKGVEPYANSKSRTKDQHVEGLELLLHSLCFQTLNMTYDIEQTISVSKVRVMDNFSAFSPAGEAASSLYPHAIAIGALHGGGKGHQNKVENGLVATLRRHKLRKLAVDDNINQSVKLSIPAYRICMRHDTAMALLAVFADVRPAISDMNEMLPPDATEGVVDSVPSAPRHANGRDQHNYGTSSVNLLAKDRPHEGAAFANIVMAVEEKERERPPSQYVREDKTHESDLVTRLKFRVHAVDGTMEYAVFSFMAASLRLQEFDATMIDMDAGSMARSSRRRSAGHRVSYERSRRLDISVKNLSYSGDVVIDRNGPLKDVHFSTKIVLERPNITLKQLDRTSSESNPEVHATASASNIRVLTQRWTSVATREHESSVLREMLKLRQLKCNVNMSPSRDLKKIDISIQSLDVQCDPISAACSARYAYSLKRIQKESQSILTGADETEGLWVDVDGGGAAASNGGHEESMEARQGISTNRVKQNLKKNGLRQEPGVITTEVRAEISDCNFAMYVPANSYNSKLDGEDYDASNMDIPMSTLRLDGLDVFVKKMENPGLMADRPSQTITINAQRVGLHDDTELQQKYYPDILRVLSGRHQQNEAMLAVQLQKSDSIDEPDQVHVELRAVEFVHLQRVEDELKHFIAWVMEAGKTELPEKYHLGPRPPKRGKFTKILVDIHDAVVIMPRDSCNNEHLFITIGNARVENCRLESGLPGGSGVPVDRFSISGAVAQLVYYGYHDLISLPGAAQPVVQEGDFTNISHADNGAGEDGQPKSLINPDPHDYDCISLVVPKSASRREQFGDGITILELDRFGVEFDGISSAMDKFSTAILMNVKLNGQGARVALPDKVADALKYLFQRNKLEQSPILPVHKLPGVGLTSLHLRLGVPYIEFKATEVLNKVAVEYVHGKRIVRPAMPAADEAARAKAKEDAIGSFIDSWKPHGREDEGVHSSEDEARDTVQLHVENPSGVTLTLRKLADRLHKHSKNCENLLLHNGRKHRAGAVYSQSSLDYELEEKPTTLADALDIIRKLRESEKSVSAKLVKEETEHAKTRDLVEQLGKRFGKISSKLSSECDRIDELLSTDT